MMHKIKALHAVCPNDAQNILDSLSNKQLEDLYCESVELRKQYSLAYQRLGNEMNRRKDEQLSRELEEQIEVHNGTL